MEDRYLFKAKDCNSIWRAGLLIGLQEGRCAIEEKDGSKWACNSKTICQCTGLKDKNGNLVWENDVVRIKYDDDFSEVGWIKYSNCGVRYNFVFGTEIYSIDDSCDIEVIGNIFDNPELINE